MSHSLQTGIMGLTGLVAVPIANGIKFITGDQNYVSYDEYMEKVAELIDESSLTTAEDKDDVYYTGRDDGEVAFFFIMYEYADSISELARSNSSASGGVTGDTASVVTNTEGSVKILGRGSTGRTDPNTLKEQIAMQQVKSNPLEGATKIPIEMTDSRWLGTEGWIKMQSVVNHSDGTKTVIHFVYNSVMNVFDDFKFK